MSLLDYITQLEIEYINIVYLYILSVPIAILPASTMYLPNVSYGITPIDILELGLFGMLKLALVLQFSVTNAYFSVTCNTKVSVRATLK